MEIIVADPPMPAVGKSRFAIAGSVVAETLQELRAAGRRGTEGVLLWAGPVTADDVMVTRCLRPSYQASAVHTLVDPEALWQSVQRAYGDGLLVVAQTHSHPGAAYHSVRDERNAFSYRPGFMSIVVPRFGLVDDLLEAMEVYEATATGWRHIDPAERARRFTVAPSEVETRG